MCVCVCVCRRSSAGGAAAGGERVLHPGVAALAGAGRSPRRRQPAPNLPAPL